MATGAFSSPPPGSSNSFTFIAKRVQYSRCSSILYFEMLLSRDAADTKVFGRVRELVAVLAVKCCWSGRFVQGFLSVDGVFLASTPFYYLPVVLVSPVWFGLLFAANLRLTCYSRAFHFFFFFAMYDYDYYVDMMVMITLSTSTGLSPRNL